MFRRPARAFGFAFLAASASIAAQGPSTADAAGGVSSPQVTGVEMTAPVRRALKQLEEQWLQWVVQNSEKGSEGVVRDLLATAGQLGMKRLPDLSIGALSRAVQAARQRDFNRARWSLAAAERLDPGRSETAFARAAVDRLQGNPTGFVYNLANGFVRLFDLPLERYLFFQDLLLWTISLLLLTGALFIAVQMAVKGGALWQDLIALFSRRLPRPAAVAFAVLVLLWPLALPSGLLWLPLFWSVLLWGYTSLSERAVLVVLWLLAGVSPLLITSQSREVTVMLSPPVQAMESLKQRRLYGGLFTDLGVLRSLLPESAAVKHLLADVHRSLKQWEIAQALYRQVLEQEPDNTAAELNLGAYSFIKGDFGSAIQHFQKVAASDPRSAAAQFNLSQAYSESYLFDENRRALSQARALDPAKVDAWIRDPNPQRVITNNRGMARIPEIRQELLATFHTREAPSARLELFRRGLSLVVPLVLVLLAVALQLARRPFSSSDPAADPMRFRSHDRWRRFLVPGAEAAESGEGVWSFLALLLPTAFAMLFLIGKLGYRLPWGYDPGSFAARIVAILGFLLYFGVRLRRLLRDDV
jgi:tetratricopeptide (TPR) repeat protein